MSVTILIVLAAAGLALIMIGVRGRRIDDHPWCRACGFDLFGAPRQAVMCPECGRDLTKPRALRIGQRRRRRAIITVGSFILLAALGWGGIQLAGSNLNPYKPTWLLLIESDGSGARRDAALNELNDRVTAGTLSDEQVRLLVARVLKTQAQSDADWSPAWGDLLEAARDAGQVTDAQWAQYMEQGVSFDPVVRANVRAGEEVAVQLRLSRVKFGTLPNRSFQVTNFKHRAGGEAWSEVSGATMAASLIPGATGTRLSTAVRTPELALGRHQLSMRFDCSVNAGWNNPLHTWTETVDVALDILPKDFPMVRLTHEPELGSLVERAISVKRMVVIPRASQSTADAEARASLTMLIQYDDLPVGVAFEVFARTDEADIRLGRITARAETGTQSRGFSETIEGFDDAVVDIVLVPSIEAAEGAVDLTEIWGGEIVIRDVPVQRQ